MASIFWRHAIYLFLFSLGPSLLFIIMHIVRHQKDLKDPKD